MTSALEVEGHKAQITQLHPCAPNYGGPDLYLSELDVAVETVVVRSRGAEGAVLVQPTAGHLSIAAQVIQGPGDVIV